MLLGYLYSHGGWRQNESSQGIRNFYLYCNNCGTNIVCSGVVCVMLCNPFVEVIYEEKESIRERRRGDGC